MARRRDRVRKRRLCFPHPRGDGPPHPSSGWASSSFSPPAWGWPDFSSFVTVHDSVFPTRVGMARNARTCETVGACFPHPRGDGPLLSLFFGSPQKFSPPAWGWPGNIRSKRGLKSVFPTRVGMARRGYDFARDLERFPHPRGDGPPGGRAPPPEIAFSPPAWGWPALWQCIIKTMRVFPTRVGMARGKTLLPEPD